ncbi:unnamed protein product [Staurois parvus]|uniref:Uncharacterized protein n=1 Tax=Staurois parvus TaxID=386267 RepID=A0ABN9FZN5_9NEOB|nr:unnamed protein product [Staurois parvus]CAI9559584.1 unnamed protein product [Staurois parvus]CAI9567008.1 unnamed protein product [Staurois parvus]CAI9602147.1 unnamed protein product [Staurois parvus]
MKHDVPPYMFKVLMNPLAFGVEKFWTNPTEWGLPGSSHSFPGSPHSSVQ